MMDTRSFADHSKYFDIASLVPEGTRVLDIGCGCGQLGAVLKKKECIVDGIDVSLERLESRKNYNMIWEDSIEDFDFNKASENYDVVVFSDVLEHLASAESVLRKTNAILAYGGRVIISLPNVAFFLNRWNLLRGRWDYAEEGILDRTHLKFFTLLTSKRLIENTGYQIHKIIPQTPVIHAPAKHAIFNLFMAKWPGMFSIGWVFEASLISDERSKSPF